MLLCKRCGGKERVRNGIVGGRQRYKCKSCNYSFREGDSRVKYSDEKRIRVVKWYLEGVGIRSIERREGVPNPLIIRWIRKFADILKKKMEKTSAPQNIRDVQIMELDELYSYCKKKRAKFISGLLWTESETKWWILK